MTDNSPILLVDDDEDECALLETAMQEANIPNPIRCFSTGEVFLKYLRTTPEHPLLILCDVNMPKMDGVAVRRQINNEEFLRRKSIPFIFYSTSATPSAVDEAYDLGVQGFFTKQTKLEKISSLIKCIYGYWTQCRHPNQH